jgi:hypothetical protein
MNGAHMLLKGQVVDLVWDESFKVYCAYFVIDVQISIKHDAIVGSVEINNVKMDDQIIKDKVKNACHGHFYVESLLV